MVWPPPKKGKYKERFYCYLPENRVMGQMFLLWHLAQTGSDPTQPWVWCMWTFVSQPGIECAPTAVEKQHPNHWTTKAFP